MRGHVVGGLLVVLALVSAAVGACSQTPTFDPASGGAGASNGRGGAGPGSGGGGGDEDADALCQSCTKQTLQKRCQAELSACNENAACAQILACASKAPDKLVECAAPLATGAIDFSALAECLCQECTTCAHCPLLGCIDGVLSGDEAAVDCGGDTCPACTGNCSNGIKDNGEVGPDCGPICGKGCVAGTKCTSGADCESDSCVDGVCCDVACNGPCEACTAARKGAGDDGVCGPIAAETDPDDECLSPGGDVCNGGGSCGCHDDVMGGDETAIDCGGPCSPCGGTCSDAILDNRETDKDCGGPNCPKCPAGKRCAKDTDCVTARCTLGECCKADEESVTCAGKCGSVTNNCGDDVDCGGCGPNEQCGVKTPNKCDCLDPTACTGRCGTITDACGAQLTCPTCTGGAACNNTHCACTDPNACNGKCGVLTNACGASVNCGNTCSGPDYCNGGGPNLCGCQDGNENWCAGVCNTTVTTDCGNHVQCGGCGGGVCMGDHTCCTVTTSCPSTKCSGYHTNNCEQTVSCNADCGGGVCVGNFCCDPDPNPCGPKCTGTANDGCQNVGCSTANCASGTDVCHNGFCCAPNPSACDEAGFQCGTTDDGCGGTSFCSGSCSCGCLGNFCDSCGSGG